MPYIEQSARFSLDEIIEQLANNIDGSGELNYSITRLLMRIAGKTRESYALYESMIGTLESVKLELYRRKVAPYEDKKRDQNGDVF